MTDPDFEDFSGLQAPADPTDLAKLSRLAADLVTQRRAIAEAEERLSRLKAAEREMSCITVPSAMRDVGMRNYALADGTGISLVDKVSCSIADDRRGPAIAWLDENGHGGLVKTQVSAYLPRTKREEARKLVAELQAQGLDADEKAWVENQTLLAHLKEMKKQGKPFPEETFKWREWTETKVVEAKR